MRVLFSPIALTCWMVLQSTITSSAQEIPITLISAIQGSSGSSPLEGTNVTIKAIVVGDFQTGDADNARNLGGFWLQEEDDDADADTATSEGIFVFDEAGGAVDGNLFITDVGLGDLVQVTGRVEERFGQTQIVAVSVAVMTTMNMIPTATAIQFPTDPDLSAFEGMLVTISTQMQIIEMFNLDRFNEIKLYTGGDRPFQFSQVNTPSIEGYAAYIEELARNAITYDDGLGSQNNDIDLLDGFAPYTTETAKRMGDIVDELTGILEYSFGVWRIRSVVDGSNTFKSANPRPMTPPIVGDGNVKMTSFNVLNFFTTLDVGDAVSGPTGGGPRGADSQEEFDRQLGKLVTALVELDADLLGLVELENDFDGDGSALNTLVAAVNAVVGDDIYTAVYPGRQFVDASDVISAGFMYKTAVLSVLGDPSILTDANLPDGSVAPIFDGPDTNRASLAVTFDVLGSSDCITVSCNHFKSKGGSGTDGNADANDGAANWNQRRLDAAIAVVEWLNTNPTGAICDHKAILGDLNAYAMEDPIQYLLSNGYVNVQDATGYSYVFDGQIGTLDYVLVNDVLSSKITGSSVWHIAEDEADAIDYNLDFGRLSTYFDGTNPARPSDHSPVLVGLNLTASATTTSPTVRITSSPTAAPTVATSAGQRVLSPLGSPSLLVLAIISPLVVLM